MKVLPTPFQTSASMEYLRWVAKVLFDGVHDEVVVSGHVEELEFDAYVVATDHVEVLDKVVDVGHVEILQATTGDLFEPG